MKKEKTIIIRVDESLFMKYKEICKINGYNMSQRLRNYIEGEIKKDGE
jgi:ribosomal protein L37E